MPTADTSFIADIESALSSIIRLSNLPRLHDHMAERSGIELDRGAYVALARIGEREQIRPSDLSAVLGVDLSTTSRQVQRLEGAGLVSRSTDPADRRACALTLTPEGERALTRARHARRQVISELLADWSQDDLTRLAPLLTRLAADLTDFSETT